MSGLEELLNGRTLAERYRIEEVIGRGGMGAVYAATDTRLGRRVAIKVITLAASTIPERVRLRARFHREAQAAAGIHHPNVATVHDLATDSELDLDFLVMELLRGEDLASLLARGGAPPLPLALRILHDAAEGLAAGHRLGLVHRDVKPGNLFLEESEEGELRVCVLDFGIALLVAGGEALTQITTEEGIGPLSPAYAAPEQLRGERDLTPAADVYSLGLIGFELLTGDRLFASDDLARGETPIPPPKLRALEPAVPAELDELLRRALAHEPGGRFPDAGAFAAALAPLYREVAGVPSAAPLPPVAAPPAEEGTALLEEPRDATATLFAAPAPAKGRSARRAWAPLVALLLLVAAVAAGAVWLGESGVDSGNAETAAQEEEATASAAEEPTATGEPEPLPAARSAPATGSTPAARPPSAPAAPRAREQPRPPSPAARGARENRGQGQGKARGQERKNNEGNRGRGNRP